MQIRAIVTIAVLEAALASSPAYPHAGEDAPAYVASNGVDACLCRDAAQPCATIAYALSRLGKGGKVRVAAGQYLVTNREE